MRPVSSLSNRQRKALRKGGHDRPLRRYEDQEETHDAADGEQDMSMSSPERDIPLHEPVEEPQLEATVPAAAASTPAQIGATLPSAPSHMPLMVGGAYILLSLEIL